MATRPFPSSLPSPRPVTVLTAAFLIQRLYLIHSSVAGVGTDIKKRERIRLPREHRRKGSSIVLLPLTFAHHATRDTHLPPRERTSATIAPCMSRRRGDGVERSVRNNYWLSQLPYFRLLHWPRHGAPVRRRREEAIIATTQGRHSVLNNACPCTTVPTHLFRCCYIIHTSPWNIISPNCVNFVRLQQSDDVILLSPPAIFASRHCNMFPRVDQAPAATAHIS
ncbi:hypothetical protein B0H16DRAFT_556111 [Mycena metata]|uniref:Uncharacterized protein n=1 Tax=Mycena metata TaxID=1033252 RepID=A0AAD7NHI7_9AGAR|nr:hypothetical protein B0H16DRAFT_556111 [Mycena metata]